MKAVIAFVQIMEYNKKQMKASRILRIGIISPDTMMEGLFDDIAFNIQEGMDMSQSLQDYMEQYVTELKNIYGSHLRQIILYGSYARGDFRQDSDIDIMILLDMSDMDLKAYGQRLSYMTYDFNLDHNLDIKPIAKSEIHFRKWVANYPFYANIQKEGVILYGAA